MHDKAVVKLVLNISFFLPLISDFSCVISFFQTKRMRIERGRISTFDISSQFDAKLSLRGEIFSVIDFPHFSIFRLSFLISNNK
jgi:hypothetical protein